MISNINYYVMQVFVLFLKTEYEYDIKLLKTFEEIGTSTFITIWQIKNLIFVVKTRKKYNKKTQ